MVLGFTSTTTNYSPVEYLLGTFTCNTQCWIFNIEVVGSIPVQGDFCYFYIPLLPVTCIIMSFHRS